MQQNIRSKQTDILVMTDHSDMIFCMKTINNCTDLTSFNAFYSRWISNFDVPTYVYVDHGSNLGAELKKEKIHEVDS